MPGTTSTIDYIVFGALTATQKRVLVATDYNEGDIIVITNMTTGGFSLDVRNLTNVGTQLALLAPNTAARFMLLSGNFVRLPAIS